MSKIISSSTKRTFSLFILATVSVAGSFTAVRASGFAPKKHKPGSANSAEVTFIGIEKGQPLFDVMYNNAKGDRFSISIVDGQGNELFQNGYTDKSFDKKFELTDAEGKLEFIIRNYKDNSVQTFEVDANTRLVEDIEVKEVK